MMNIPAFYNPEKVGTLYLPDIASATAAGRQANCSPAAEDDQKVLLLLVDPQVDFIHTDGALSVPGAVDDTRRTIEWLFSNLERVTTIAASLDTHVPIQIFYPGWWIDKEGNHPAPYTLISAQDVKKGKWQPTIEEAWSIEYVDRLEKAAKKVLTIWPYHTMLGTPGHAITPALYEAIICHSTARQTEPILYVKGSIPKTEHYSILEPEVKVKGDPLGTLNIDLIDRIGSYDLVYMAGQAKSHCVLETADSLVTYYSNNRAELINRWRMLSDCTSSVVHPEIDFEAMANAKLAEYELLGLQLVSSDQPIG
ncbi:MAG: nicotinamidase [Anaerolineae bacterium]|nr:nicotinamidase [Anaerolineae bacterium]